MAEKTSARAYDLLLKNEEEFRKNGDYEVILGKFSALKANINFILKNY